MIEQETFRERLSYNATLLTDPYLQMNCAECGSDFSKRIDPAVEIQEGVKHGTHLRFVGCLAPA